MPGQIFKRYMTYAEAKSCKYALAFDKDSSSGAKGYYGFDNTFELFDRIEHIRSNLKQRVYYEVILPDTFKPYYDLDHISMSITELTEILLPAFVELFNRIFGTKITGDDVLLYHRQDGKSPIASRLPAEPATTTSSHFIVTSHKVSKADMKTTIAYLQMMEPELFGQLDKTIYTINRPFNLPYNTKFKYFVRDEGKNPSYLIDSKPQPNDPRKYLSSYTVGIPEANVDRYKKLAIAVAGIFDKAPQSTYFSQRPTLKSCFQQWRTYKAESAGADVIATTALTRNDQIIASRLPAELAIISPIDAYDYMMANLPDRFYNNSPDWKMIVKILKKYGLTSSQFQTLNQVSILRAKRNKWTEDGNNIYFDSIDTTMVKGGKPLFKTIIEKYISRCNVVYNKNQYLVDWLEVKTEMDNVAISDAFVGSNKTDIIKLGSFEYAQLSGFLTRSPSPPDMVATVLGNYYIEITHKAQYNTGMAQNVIEFDKIADIAPYILDFNENKIRLLSVKCKWGGGKTFYAVGDVINYAHNHGCRVVIITENNSLNQQLANTFSTKNLHFISHIDNNQREMNSDRKKGVCQISTTDNNDTQHIVCSAESIQKVVFRNTDVLILDEYESLLNHYESDTFKGLNDVKFKDLKNAIQTSMRVIVLDADISKDRIGLLQRIRPADTCVNLYAKTNNFADYTFNVLCGDKSEDTLYTKIHKDVAAGKNICFASTTKGRLDKFYETCKSKYSGKVILKVTGDPECVLFADGNETMLDKVKLLENLEESICSYKVNLFLYSPTIKTGVSINVQYFHKCYAFGHSSSLCAREFIQMLFRARRLIDKTITMAFNCRIGRTKASVSAHEIEAFYLDPIKLLQSLEIFNQTPNKDKIKNYTVQVDADYLTMRIQNMYESHTSHQAYAQDVLSRLLYSHDLKLNYILDDEDVTDKEEQYPKPHELVQCNLIGHEMYMRGIGISWQEKVKYELFQMHYYIKGVTGKLEPDQDVVDTINNDQFYATYCTSDMKSKYYGLKWIYGNNMKDLCDEVEASCGVIVPDSTGDNKLNRSEAKSNKRIMARKLLDFLGIVSLEEIPYKMTNRVLQQKIESPDSTRFLIELNAFVSMHTLGSGQMIVFEPEKLIKTTKAVMSSILGDVGIVIRCENGKNTSRPTDKLVIQYDKFCNIIHMPRRGRLAGDKFRIDPDAVAKIGRAFKHKTTDVKLYQNTNGNRVYYTTYAIQLSCGTAALKKRIVHTDNKDVIAKILLEMQDYRIATMRPVAVSEKDYKQMRSDLITKVEQNAENRNAEKANRANLLNAYYRYAAIAGTAGYAHQTPQEEECLVKRSIIDRILYKPGASDEFAQKYLKRDRLAATTARYEDFFNSANDETAVQTISEEDLIFRSDYRIRQLVAEKRVEHEASIARRKAEQEAVVARKNEEVSSINKRTRCEMEKSKAKLESSARLKKAQCLYDERMKGKPVLVLTGEKLAQLRQLRQTDPEAGSAEFEAIDAQMIYQRNVMRKAEQEVGIFTSQNVITRAADKVDALNRRLQFLDRNNCEIEEQDRIRRRISVLLAGQ